MTTISEDPIAYLEAARRPRLLMEAARLGLTAYDRTRGLGRLLGAIPAPGPGVALVPLAEREMALEAARTLADATYSPRAHVELMTALLAEARLAFERA